MIITSKSPYEEKRINALKSYDILDTTPESDFDDVTLMASQICDTPIAYISLLDEERQWFKSLQGASMTSVPRSGSICDTAIKSPNEITVIEDAREDERFYNNMFVKPPFNIVFYASVPLLSPEGLPIGTICVLDKKARKITAKQKNALKALSKQVMSAFEIRKNKKELEQSLKALVYKNTALEGFTDNSVDGMRSPLNTISLISELTRKKYSGALNEKDTEYLGIIEKSTKQVINMLNDIKEFHGNLDLIIHKRESFFVNELLADIKNRLNNNQRIKIQTDIIKVYANKAAINKILSDIIDNSIKRTSTKDVITIHFEYQKGNLLFTIKDNGLMLEDNNLNLSNNSPKLGEDYSLDFISTVKILAHSLGGAFEIIHSKEVKNIIKFSIFK